MATAPSYSDRAPGTASVAPPPTAAGGLHSIGARRKYRRRDTNSLSESKSDGSEDEAGSSMSGSEEHELGLLESDAEGEGDVDAETGLDQHKRRAFIKRQRRRETLASRIAGTMDLSREEGREADRNVLRNLLTNAALIGAWYFFSLAISIYNKMMFSSDHVDFHFPLFATSLHMIVQFSLASAVLLIFPAFRPTQPDSRSTQPLVTTSFYLTRLVPTGTTTSLDIGLGNASFRFITLSFYTMCKSSVLIFVLAFAFLFRLEKPSVKLVLIILTMTVGVVMMAAGEAAFNALGFALAMSASFFSGFRWALTQILLLRHPATSNPFATLFFLAPIMFVTLFVIACVVETPAAVIVGVQLLVQEQGIFKALLMLIVPGGIAFCMIASEFTLLQRTSVVTLSICGIFKEIVTISAGGIVFDDKLSIVNISGLIVTILCIGCYNYLKVVKMRAEAREQLRKNDVEPFDEGEYDGGRDGDSGPAGPAVATCERNEDAAAPLMRDQENRGF